MTTPPRPGRTGASLARRATPGEGRTADFTGSTGTFSTMTDTATDQARAQAALASHKAPELRLLRAVHNGLVALPDHRPTQGRQADDDEARAAG